MGSFRFFRFVFLLALVSGGSLGVFGQDSLKVVANGNVAISDLILHSDQDTLLQVLGKGSTDSTWVPVNADWDYAAATGNKTASGRSSWRFAPGDTGFGTLVVSFGGYVADTVSVEVRPGDAPESIVIYNRELLPGPGVLALYDPSQAIPITAGTTYLLSAKVFDWKTDSLTQYQVSPLDYAIAWNSYGSYDGESAAIDTTRGAACRFKPTKAYDTVTVSCLLRPSPGRVLTDQLTFVVLPAAGTRHFLVESTKAIDLNQPEASDTVSIPANDQSRSVYATVRDSFGNFVRFCNVARWVSLDTDIVTVQKGDTSFGEGIITRNPQALHSIARIYSVDSSGTPSDTFVVKLLFPTALREKEPIDRSDRWSIATSGGTIRLRIPFHGTRTIKAYSLSGSIIYSSRTSANDAEIKLPKGVYVLSVRTIGSAERFTTKIFNQ